MTFPKSPSKPVTGKLRIIIKKPTEVQFEADNDPIIHDGPDDKEIKFRLPAGFGLDSDLSAVLDRQLTIAHKSVTEIESRYKECNSCRKKDYNPGGIADVRRAIDLTAEVLKGKNTSPTKVLLAHEKNGDISLEIGINDKTVILVTTQPDSMVAKYENRVIQDSAPFTPHEFESMLGWMLEDG